MADDLVLYGRQLMCLPALSAQNARLASKGDILAISCRLSSSKQARLLEMVNVLQTSRSLWYYLPMRNVFNQNGFTFLAALMLVVVIGIMLGLTAEPWKTIIKREREQELIFRGLEYRKAIAAWNTRQGVAGGNTGVTPLNDLKDLLLDPRTLEQKKYLRQLYKDPMTGKDWKVIRDIGGGKGIVGVVSTSNDVPLKTSFSEYSGLDIFSQKHKYSEWRFVFGTDPDLVSTVKMPQ